MSGDLQATTAGMLKANKLMIDTKHIALVRPLRCRKKQSTAGLDGIKL